MDARPLPHLLHLIPVLSQYPPQYFSHLMLLFTAILYTIPLLFLMLPLLRLFFHVTIKEAGEPVAFESAIPEAPATLQDELNELGEAETQSQRSPYFQRPIAIVTGSNAGIGQETARGLWRRGYIVIMACRSMERAEAARKEILKKPSFNPATNYQPNPEHLMVMILDLSDLDSVRDFTNEYKSKYDRVDVIVANAGVISPIGVATKQGFEMTYGVSYLGHQLLFELLIPLMERREGRIVPRIVVLSSVLHKKAGKDLSKMHYKERMRLATWPEALGRGIPATSSQYAFVKLMNLLQGKLLHERFHKQRGILVNVVHPGIVKSEISRSYTNGFIRWIMNFLFLSPEQGAQTSIHCASARGVEEENLSGFYWSNCKVDSGIHSFVEDDAVRRIVFAETMDQLRDYLGESGTDSVLDAEKRE